MRLFYMAVNIFFKININTSKPFKNIKKIIFLKNQVLIESSFNPSTKKRVFESVVTIVF